MTTEEAKKVVGTIKGADNGCTVCVAELLRSLQRKFPDHDWAELAGDDYDTAQEWRDRMEDDD